MVTSHDAATMQSQLNDMAKSRKTDTIDAGRQHLGSVYAKALLGAAEKAGQADTVVEELEALVTRRARQAAAARRGARSRRG